MLVVTIAPRTSRADGEGDRAPAQEFFDRGVKLRDAGKCQAVPVGNAASCRESIDAFRHAYALNPSALGALRNMAQVERSLGLVTSAARHFHELAGKAPLDPKPERQRWGKFAEEEAKALKPRGPHLVVKVPTDRPADLKVYLDDQPLAESAWGVSMDVDPGAHAIRAESPKVPTFAVSLDLAERELRSIEVIFPAPTPVPETPTPVTHERPAAAVVDVRKTNLTPILVATAGALVLGGGLVAGIAAGNERDSSCDVATKLCDPNGLTAAKTLATTSTILVLAGWVTVVGGLAWLIVSPTTAATPQRKAQAPRFSPYVSPRGGGFTGTF